MTTPRATNSDCKTKEGITVGLIDSLLSICRVLAPRLKGFDSRLDSPISEALKDLGCDNDLNLVLSRCPVMRLPDEEAKLYERVALSRMESRTSEQETRLRELDKWVETLPTRARNEPESFGDLMFQLAIELPSMTKRQ